MNFGESVLFASIMTLMDEVKSKKPSGTQAVSQPNSTDIKFTFENLKVKDKLISLAEQLFTKANEASNTFVEMDIPLMISSLIVGCIYESVKSISGDYETQSKIFDYAVKYCNVQTEFTWDTLQSDEEIESVLKQLYEMTLNVVFVASSVSGANDISNDFIRVITELMDYMEQSIIYRFASVSFSQRPPLVALDMIISAMKREMHRLEEEDPSLKEESVNQIEGSSVNSSGGCYVATAVYGSYDCPQVWTLRRFRDYSLAKSWLGRSFIRFYYATSPTLVKLFGHTKWFNVGCRKILDKFVDKLMADGYENTYYADDVKDKIDCPK